MWGARNLMRPAPKWVVWRRPEWSKLHSEMDRTQLTQALVGNRLLDFPLLRHGAEGCRSKGKHEF